MICQAIEQAVPLSGQPLPVVVLSHGLNGWATGWSTLAENLASTGYVVIAIDRRDRDGIEEGGIGRSFGESILRHPVDQRAVLKALAEKSASLPSWLQSMVRCEQAALVGYSMGANRDLLTYQNARHNIAMNPTPSQVRHLFVYRERFDEPVWRSDRLQAINAHMITAFFDKTLGANGVGEANLAMPVKRAIDGQWPLGPGVSAGLWGLNLSD
jgi:predicted alpha/beta-fold hydrolase